MKQQESEYFRTRKEAHDWLKEQGFAVSRGKFYADIEQQGFPVLNADKSLSRYQVLVYANQLGATKQPDPSALSRSEFLHRKEKADAEIAEMKAERMRREEDAYWLSAEDAWSAIAALIGNLRDVIRRYLQDAQVDITTAGGGDAGRAPEVFELCDQVVGRAFNEVAGKEIEVEWKEVE